MTTDSLSSSTAKLIKRLQGQIAFFVAFCWIVNLIYLLIATTTPKLGAWAGPPHLTSSLFLALVIAAALSDFVQNNSLLGWWTIIVSTACIVAFECLQLLTPERTFEFSDISEGVAGAAMAAMIVVALCRITGRAFFVWLAITVGVVVLVATNLLWINEEKKPEIHCDKPVTSRFNWQFQSIREFRSVGKGVLSNIGTLCTFTDKTSSHSAVGVVTTVNTSQGPKSIKLTGGGLVSAPLPGLREALSETGELTFGVRFRADKLRPGGPPRLIASLQSKGKRLLVVTRITQNGPHASASLQFAPLQNTSTSMFNRLQNKFHEIVLTYDGSVQTTYLDSISVGTENAHIKAIEETGGELFLNIGKRTDGRWNGFHGEIEAIIIGTKSVSADEISTLFQHSK